MIRKHVIGCFVLLACGVGLEGLRLRAQPPSSGAARLEYIAVLNRHGVRTPLWTNDRLNEYSTGTWPQWDVRLGDLTEHGRVLMKLLGEYDRAYLSNAGLIGTAGCDDAARFYFWSDVTGRDIESGQWLSAGMFPGCTVNIHAVPAGARDPLFSPLSAVAGKPDGDLAAAAVLGRIGGHPETLGEIHRGRLEAMERVLLGCEPASKQCPPEGKAVKQNLLEQTTAVRAQAGRMPQFAGPLSAAASIAESFMMEYTDGMKEQDVGWGRVTKTNLRDLMYLQEAYNDLALRTPYIARVNGSNLLSHMLRSMQQAVRGEKVPGALGKPDDRGLFLMGHDSDLSYFGGMLGISWVLEDYQPNCRPPGASLVFEIWKDSASGKRTVRTYFLSQTLDQLRNATPLSLQAPPERAPIFIPGCSTAAEGWACDWEAFQRKVEASIDPAFVTQGLPAERASELAR